MLDQKTFELNYKKLGLLIADEEGSGAINNTCRYTCRPNSNFTGWGDD